MLKVSPCKNCGKVPCVKETAGIFSIECCSAITFGGVKEKVIAMWNEREPDIQQDMCDKCHGMKTLTIDGKVVSPLEWTRHGFAVDMGCIC